jgi:predicted 3-demethylubiquinone-9 3-methyltransferase (glyoxalase superfamily)
MALSKISPCLWYKDDAEEAVNFYVSLLPDSHIDHVQRNFSGSPAGEEGTVLVIDFTLAGQTFLALNGGSHSEYTYAMSLSVDCADQAEVDRLWDAIIDGGGRAEQCGWVRDKYGVPWQIVPSMLARLIGDPDRVKGKRVMDAMLKMVKLDIATLQAAYDGKA